MEPNPVDHLERARSGGITALETLVALFGDLSYRLAYLLTGDGAKAEAATRQAWLGVWRELPSLHSERAFRPWLLSTVVEAAKEFGGTLPREMRALADADHEVQAVAALRFGLGLRLGEVALSRFVSIGQARRSAAVAAQALAAEGAPGDEQGLMHAFADHLRGIELRDSFVEDELLPRLSRTPIHQQTRDVTAQPDAMFASACSPSGLSALMGVELRGRARTGHAGARLTGRGRFADRWRANYTVTITQADPTVVAWFARIMLLGATRPIELRGRVTISPTTKGSQIVGTLDGIATVTNGFDRLSPAARASLPSRLGSWLQKGVERLAGSVTTEARPPRMPL